MDNNMNNIPIWNREDSEWWQNYTSMVNSSFSNRQIYAIPDAGKEIAKAAEAARENAGRVIVPGRTGSGRASSNRFSSHRLTSEQLLTTSGRILTTSGKYVMSSWTGGSGRPTTNRFSSGIVSSGIVSSGMKLAGSGAYMGSRSGSYAYTGSGSRYYTGSSVGVLGLGYGIRLI